MQNFQEKTKQISGFMLIPEYIMLLVQGSCLYQSLKIKKTKTKQTKKKQQK